MQILSNNLLYDFSQVPIPTDKVDPEQVARPAPWSIGHLTRFRTVSSALGRPRRLANGATPVTGGFRH